jgi:hypothetical protein
MLSLEGARRHLHAITGCTLMFVGATVTRTDAGGIAMNTFPWGVVLPYSPRPRTPTRAARYAVYALDELAQIAFGALADAVGDLESRGMRVPTVLAASRSRSQSVVGLCSAVEDALVAVMCDRKRVDATASRLRVEREDLVDALGWDGLTFSGSIVSPRDIRQREHEVLALGRRIALLSLLDELRARELAR